MHIMHNIILLLESIIYIIYEYSVCIWHTSSWSVIFVLLWASGIRPPLPFRDDSTQIFRVGTYRSRLSLSSYGLVCIVRTEGKRCCGITFYLVPSQ